MSSTKLYNWWCNTVLKPVPKYFPDAEEYETRFKKNRIQGNVMTLILILQLILMKFSNFSDEANKHILWITFAIYSSFIIFCRTYPMVFYLFYTLTVSIIPWVIMPFVSDMILFELNIVFFIVLFIFLLSESFLCYLIMGISQSIMFRTKYCRDLLIESVMSQETTVFAERFLQALTLSFILSLVGSAILIYMLNKKTNELQKANKVAKEALEQQKTFILSFSHELRNPIHSLLGNLQMVLLGGTSPEAATQMVKTAKVCGELLLQFINNVLDTGKLDIGKFEINCVPTKTHDLFKRIWMVYYELIKEKKLKSILKIQKKVCSTMLIDPHRINQMLLNLIGNAVKFTEKGTISLTIDWLEGESVSHRCFLPTPYDDEDEGIFERDDNFSRINSNKYLMLSCDNGSDIPKSSFSPRSSSGVLKIIVKDTGTGMTKEELSKIFEKFSQVSQDSHKRQIGTGLGLFITREICKKMKGEIRAYSKPKEGTTFIACIPATSLPQEQTENTREILIKKLVDKKIKAIVADDSPFNLTLMQNYFSTIEGKVIASVDNGYKAYSKYVGSINQGDNIDVITLDIDMPVMDGKEACRKIRQFEKENNIKPTIIILISGNYEEGQITDYIRGSGEIRANHFLKKPVSLEEFVEACKLLLVQ